MSRTTQLSLVLILFMIRILMIILPEPWSWSWPMSNSYSWCCSWLPRLMLRVLVFLALEKGIEKRIENWEGLKIPTFKIPTFQICCRMQKYGNVDSQVDRWKGRPDHNRRFTEDHRFCIVVITVLHFIRFIFSWFGSSMGACFYCVCEHSLFIIIFEKALSE